VRGISYVSDIAIDDVAILQGDDCAVKNESTSVTAGDYGKLISPFVVENRKDSCQLEIT